MKRITGIRSRTAAAAVLCAAVLLSSCSASELFDNLPGENATELYSREETQTVPPPVMPEGTESDDTDTAADSQPDAVAASESLSDGSDNSSEAEKKIVILNAPDNSYAAEYFLDGEPDEARRLYRALYEGIFAYQTTIDIEDGIFDAASVEDMINLVVETGTGLEAPESSYRMYVDGGQLVTKVEFKYAKTFEEGGSSYDQLMARADEIVKEAQPLLTEYDKIKYFHDTLINNCTFDLNAPNAHSAYGALCEGRAVCEGYAKAFQLLCEKSGIHSLPVQGDATDTDGVTQQHMWNKVSCDGEWYNVDVTWDDPKGDKQVLRYDYFLIDDTACSRSHFQGTNRYMTFPSATDAFGDYYARNGLIIGYDSDINSQMYTYAEAALPEGWTTGTIDVRCLDQNLYMQTKQEFFTDLADGTKGFSELIKTFMQAGDSIRYEFTDNPQTYTFSITIEKG